MRAFLGLSLVVVGLVGACATPSAKTEISANERECRVTPGFGGAPGNRICATTGEWAAYDAQRSDNTQLATQDLRARTMQRSFDEAPPRQYDVPASTSTPR
jgi:hypothetical protein